MSVTTIRTLFCDQNVAPDCHTWAFEAPENGVTLRRWARHAGWMVNRPGGEDICPPCVAFIHLNSVPTNSTAL